MGTSLSITFLFTDTWMSQLNLDFKSLFFEKSLLISQWTSPLSYHNRYWLVIYPIGYLSSIYLQGQRQRDLFIRRNWLHDYGGWEVSQSATCKLQANSIVPVQAWRSSPRTGEDWCSSSTARHKEWILPCLFVLFWLSVDWLIPTHTGEEHKLLCSDYWFKC